MMNGKLFSILQQQALFLTQALLGVISPNFRMVWISVEEGIRIHVVLELESDEDFEEIDGFKSEYEALQPIGMEYKVEMSVSKGELKWPNRASSIVVYKRREE